MNWDCAVLAAMESAFHSLAASREKSLVRVECCPGAYSEDTSQLPALAGLSVQEGL